MSDNKPMSCLDKINNREKDLFNLTKKVLRKYAFSKKVSKNVLKHSCVGLTYCIESNNTLCRDIYKKIKEDYVGDDKMLLSSLFNMFYTKLAAPAIGEYFLRTKEVPLNKDDIDFLAYNSLSCVLFIISGMAGAMFNEAITNKSENKNDD